MKTWFSTGASRGYGRIWAEAALARGDKLVVTARKLADAADLAECFSDAVLPLALDVTNSEQVRQVVRQAHAHFGRLDVVLNSAGYSLAGTVEEARLMFAPCLTRLLWHASRSFKPHYLCCGNKAADNLPPFTSFSLWPSLSRSAIDGGSTPPFCTLATGNGVFE